MDLKTAERVWEQILSIRHEKLKQALVVKAVEYAQLRANWYWMDAQSRR